MNMKRSRHDGGGVQATGPVWPKKGEAVFACGKKDGVLSRCSVERMDRSGASLLSERKYSPGEEVGVQFNVGLGKNEFGAKMLNGRIKACREVKLPGAGRMCRAEALWAPGAFAGAAAI